MSRSIKSTDEWIDLVKKYETSGKSMAAFCREVSLAQTTFSYWVKKFSSKKEPNKLIKIKQISQNKVLGIELVIDGIKIDIPMTYPSEKISKLIVTLREVL